MKDITMKYWVAVLVIAIMSAILLLAGYAYGNAKYRLYKKDIETREAIARYRAQIYIYGQERARDSLLILEYEQENERITNDLVKIQKAGDERRFQILILHTDSILSRWERAQPRLDSIRANRNR